MKQRRCKNCNQLFAITARHPEQKYCSRKECQKARKNNWQRRKLSSDEDYRKNQADCQERWVEKHPGYWKQYRKKQRERNRINRRQPPTNSPAIANMDAKQPQKPLISGYYELTPITGLQFANMASIVVRIDEAVDSRACLVD